MQFLGSEILARAPLFPHFLVPVQTMYHIYFSSKNSKYDDQVWEVTDLVTFAQDHPHILHIVDFFYHIEY